jgi:hypothetical protein
LRGLYKHTRCTHTDTVVGECIVSTSETLTTQHQHVPRCHKT